MINLFLLSLSHKKGKHLLLNFIWCTYSIIGVTKSAYNDEMILNQNACQINVSGSILEIVF